MNKNISSFYSKEFYDGTILNIANSFSHLPASFMKVGGTIISDAPEEIGAGEFACMVYGHGSRRIVLLSDYSGKTIYTRSIFLDSWRLDKWENFNK